MSPRRTARADPGAKLFQRLLGWSFLVAWGSLGAQVDVLVGSRGLLPASDFAAALSTRPDLSFFDVPTLFRFDASDAALHGGIVVGLGLAALVALGIAPRLCLALGAVLYLSYAVVARSFLSFQWDNLLLECGLLGALLSTRGRTPWVLFLLRVLLFKLYFESGLAKYQSAISDWKDGSAMAYYYETAPIPTRLAWYAHHLPAAWHAFESRATLAFELGVPFAMFLGRPGRLVSLAVFTGFQALNIATANYGFFSYLALVLGVTLLDARDLAWARARRHALARRIRSWRPELGRRTRRAHAELRLLRATLSRRFRLHARLGEDGETIAYIGRLTLAAGVTAIYLAASIEGAVDAFFPEAPHPDAFASVARAIAPFRVVNTYHLFGQITRERVEPTFETFDGATWTSHDLRFKPGDPTRPPPLVAPHQPRVDFLLWFYGLGYDRGVPAYVRTLLQRLCTDPGAVQTLFTSALPASPRAVRVAFLRYHFTTAEERSRTGAWWTTEPVGTPRTMQCTR